MAIDRFTNNDILTTIKSPVDSVDVYSLEDKVNLSSNIVKLQSSAFVNPDCQFEVHTYSADKLVNSHTDSILYELNRTDESVDTNILIKPERDIRLSNLDSGYYITL